MKNLERILAENMLRFNPKNLSATEKYNLQQLIAEQDFRTTAPVATAATGDIKSYINNAQCVFTKTLLERKLTPKEFEIEAEFFNNMVTLDKGLMSANLAAIDAKIKEIVAACTGPQFAGKEFKVVITGQATSANPGMQGPKGVALDHPGGKPYGGLDIKNEDNKQPGNMYLAKQRAESIRSRLLNALTAAGVDKRVPNLPSKISTEGRVVTGDRAARGKRIIKVLVYVPEVTKDPVFKDGVFANVNVFYEYTWAQYQLGSAGAWVNNPNPPFKPVIKSGWSITFGVSGAGPDVDFSVSWGGGSSQAGFPGGFSPMNRKPGFIDANGKLEGESSLHQSQPTNWFGANQIAKLG